MAEDFLHVAGLVQVSTGNYTMRPFILVGIENTERRRDMTGPTTKHRDSSIAKHVNGSAAFRKFIRTELMPRIKSRYRATDETAVVGELLAGLFIVELFFASLNSSTRTSHLTQVSGGTITSCSIKQTGYSARADRTRRNSSSPTATNLSSPISRKNLQTF